MDCEQRLLQELEELKDSKIPLVLYGAGEVCQICVRAIEALNVSFPVYVCDRDTKLQHAKIFKNYEIYSLDEIKERIDKANFVICVYRSQSVRDIREYLQKATTGQIQKIYQKEMLFYFYTVSVMHRKVDSHIYAESICKIAQINEEGSLCDTDIAVPMTSKCSLLCKNCAYLLPHIRDRKDFDVRMIVDSIRNLADALGYCEIITLVGGEPFLAKYLVEIADQISRMSNVMVVRMISNGTLLPNEKLVHALKDKVTCVMISDYGEVSRSKEQMQHELNQEGICCYIGYRNTFNEWFPVETPKKQNRSSGENMALAKKCMRCYMVKDAKLFACTYSAWGMTEHLMEPFEDDYVDLLDADRLVERLEILQHKKVLQCCDYCRVDFEGRVPVGEQ